MNKDNFINRILKRVSIFWGKYNCQSILICTFISIQFILYFTLYINSILGLICLLYGMENLLNYKITITKN
eukprot:UN25771